MSTFTPGPWYAKKTSAGQSLIASEATGATVAVAYAAEDGPMLAAAPAMAEALEDWEGMRFQIIDALKRLPDSENLRAAIHETLDRNRAILSSIEGN